MGLVKSVKLYFLVVFIVNFVGNISVVKAQQVEGNIDFYSFSDNREYTDYPQTIFGLQVSPTGGLVIDKMHRLRAGVNVLYEFGSRESSLLPIAYYEYKQQRWNFLMGTFPRKDLSLGYPRALLTDTLAYYRSNVEGMFLQYNYKYVHQNIWIDWTSRQTDKNREAFLFGTSGSYKRGMFFLSNYFYMLHNFTPKIPDPNKRLEDNGAIMLKLGVDFKNKTFLDSLVFSASGIVSLERVRDFEKSFRTPKGFLVEAYAKYKQFIVGNSFYRGEGHDLIYGDKFYRAKSYNRVDLGWEPKINSHITCKFVFSLHFANNAIDNQQAFTMRYNFGALSRVKLH